MISSRSYDQALRAHEHLLAQPLATWRVHRNFQRRKINRESQEQKEGRNMVRKRRGRGVKLVQYLRDGAQDDDEA